AESVLQEAIARLPQHKEALEVGLLRVKQEQESGPTERVRGDASAAKKRYGFACGHYRAALGKTETSQEAATLFGLLYGALMRVNQYEDAYSAAREAVKLQPGWSKVYRWQGDALIGGLPDAAACEEGACLRQNARAVTALGT
ncbi:hypothetical protein CYMTET_53127, partial [Cymbomonas tetramitiformis]